MAISCTRPWVRSAVVRVGLVALHHGELGVVLARHALVAEHPADLVDTVEASDQQPLQVQLVRDAEVELLVVGVVMRGEGPRGGATIDGLQHRRLDLEEAPAFECAPHGGHDAAALQDQATRLLVDEQVEVALAKAYLDIRQAVPLLGQG
jgi:hypothetical protein